MEDPQGLGLTAVLLYLVRTEGLRGPGGRQRAGGAGRRTRGRGDAGTQARRRLLRWVRRSCPWAYGGNGVLGNRIGIPAALLTDLLLGFVSSVRVRRTGKNGLPIPCRVPPEWQPPWLQCRRRMLRLSDPVDSRHHAALDGCTCFGERGRTCWAGSCRPCTSFSHSRIDIAGVLVYHAGSGGS